jgi:hypothetical protein
MRIISKQNLCTFKFLSPFSFFSLYTAVILLLNHRKGKLHLALKLACYLFILIICFFQSTVQSLITKNQIKFISKVAFQISFQPQVLKVKSTRSIFYTFQVTLDSLKVIF